MVSRISKALDSIQSLPGKLDPSESARKAFGRGVEVAIGSHEFDRMLQRRDYGLMPWEDSAKKYGYSDIKDYPGIKEKTAYGAGRVAGTFASDNMRNWWWRWNHPLGIANSLGDQIPRVAGMVNRLGKPKVVPSVLSGFALATALDLASGNTDPFNMAEGGRPKGYSAILPSPEDPTKSLNMAMEIPLGYVTGRKGKLLPYEDFVKERPDVSPEKYQEYKDYQGWNTPGLFGLEKANPVVSSVVGAGLGAIANRAKGGRISKGALVGGVMGALAPAIADVASRTGMVKGTWSNLEDQPEFQLLGYKVPLTGLVGAGTAALGIYGVNRAIVNKQNAMRLEETERSARIALERGRKRAKELGRAAKWEKELDSLDPKQRAKYMSEINQLMADPDMFEVHRNNEELKARMVHDRLSSMMRADQIYGPTPTLSPEDDARVAAAVEDFKRRKWGT